MSSLNKVLIIGRVGKDPVINYTKSGKVVANFSVATSGYGKEDIVEWHKITAWDKLAENCHKFLTKGKLCYVEGRLTTRSYDKNGDKHYITEIIANAVQFLSSASKENAASVPIQSSVTIPDFDGIPF